MKPIVALALLYSVSAFANPYPIPELVPVDPPSLFWLSSQAIRFESEAPVFDATEVLRIQIDWQEAGEKYTLGELRREMSGTPGLLARSATQDPLGSYQGVLKDASSGKALAFDALGTGKEFRKLTRAITFHFPLPREAVVFELTAENPVTGRMEKVFETRIDPSQATAVVGVTGLETRLLRAATKSPSLKVVFYAEGYLADRKAEFWSHAAKAVAAFDTFKFAMIDHLEFHAVFAPSRVELGAARNLGQPIPERDSFLGLYYPYWSDLERWYHVVYPTRESRFRAGIGQVAYDYPVVLVDSAEYWGIGNYREMTAVPARNWSFRYLVQHEFGHYLGLNEEYEGGGRTELEFAPGIEEPWSQNITFLRSKKWEDLKWNAWVGRATPLPTPSSFWYSVPSGKGFGAYRGGYGDSDSARSHKPGYACAMESDSDFCPVCLDAIERVMKFDSAGK